MAFASPANDGLPEPLVSPNTALPSHSSQHQPAFCQHRNAGKDVSVQSRVTRATAPCWQVARVRRLTPLLRWPARAYLQKLNQYGSFYGTYTSTETPSHTG
jgi:hypothetical protein